eukprot:Seg3647.4 transcript_id=Seg3647.4/GoldUCD/mRNA.D3Y31 product="hypothetical protein" protein_id=Seg3647.4/GoldUCD/D3Y31
MGLIQPLILLSTVCLVCSARYVDESDAALKTSLKEKASMHLSSCKTKSRAAYHLCFHKVAETEEERLACARLYVETFTKCYFKGVASGKDCMPRGYAMFEECVMESMGYEDVYACRNEKNAWLVKCNKATTQGDKREMLKSSDHMLFNEALYKRGSVVLCNNCRTEFSLCTGTANRKEDHQVCVVDKDACSIANDC